MRKFWQLGALALSLAACGGAATTTGSTASLATAKATATPTAKATATVQAPLTPTEFITAMTGKTYPPNVAASSSSSWGAFQQYGTQGNPQAGTGTAPNALVALGVSSPDLSLEIDYYVFPNTQDATAFYSAPSVGVAGFNFQGMTRLTSVSLPSGTEAFGVTECGGTDLELTPTTCSNGGSTPFVVGAALYSLNGFVVTVTSEITGATGSLGSSGAAEVAAADKAIPVSPAAVSFMEKVLG
jgi:hypothetical protein